MTQEIKLKLEQATAHYDTSDYDACNHNSDFLAGAKTILENPEEWGLMPILDSMEHIEESDQNWIEAVNDLKSQLAKYRNALESIVNTSTIDAVAFPLQTVSEFYSIAKEALKQGEK